MFENFLRSSVSIFWNIIPTKGAFALRHRSKVRMYNKVFDLIVAHKPHAPKTVSTRVRTAISELQTYAHATRGRNRQNPIGCNSWTQRLSIHVKSIKIISVRMAHPFNAIYEQLCHLQLLKLLIRNFNTSHPIAFEYKFQRNHIHFLTNFKNY